MEKGLNSKPLKIYKTEMELFKQQEKGLKGLEKNFKLFKPFGPLG